MKTYFTLIVLLALIVSACSDDAEKCYSASTNTTCRVEQLAYTVNDEDFIFQFEYNEENRLVFAGNSASSWTVTYHEDGTINKVVEARPDYAREFNYTHFESRTEMVIKQLTNPSDDMIRVLYRNQCGEITKVELLNEFRTLVSGPQQYIWSKGNVVEVRSNHTTCSSEKYFYDTNLNPFRQLGEIMLHPMLLGRNNVIGYDGCFPSWEHELIYDEAGYPLAFPVGRISAYFGPHEGLVSYSGCN